MRETALQNQLGWIARTDSHEHVRKACFEAIDKLFELECGGCIHDIKGECEKMCCRGVHFPDLFEGSKKNE